MSKYKILHVSQLEVEGFDFESLTYVLLGKGVHVIVEHADDIGWFPMCGENRFKTKRAAEQAIADRIQMNKEIADLPKSEVTISEVDALAKALQAGGYDTPPSQLTHGSALIVEDLDLSGMGLYREKDPSVSNDDYFPAEEKIGRWGVGYLMRKSDEGVKRQTFTDKKLKLWKDLAKKDE